MTEQANINGKLSVGETTAPAFVHSLLSVSQTITVRNKGKLIGIAAATAIPVPSNLTKLMVIWIKAVATGTTTPKSVLITSTGGMTIADLRGSEFFLSQGEAAGGHITTSLTVTPEPTATTPTDVEYVFAGT